MTTIIIIIITIIITILIIIVLFEDGELVGERGVLVGLYSIHKEESIKFITTPS